MTFSVDDFTLLQQYQATQAQRPTDPLYRLPLKAVVFSQFRAYLNGLGSALLEHGFKIGKFYEKGRLKDLARFKNPESGVQVLLIGKEGSHGLDLSLATHVFLMDQIWDQNLLNQVVSRAYRMGAQAPVRVEKLIMQDTVEELMEALATATTPTTLATQQQQDDDDDDDEAGGRGDDDGLGEDAGSVVSASSSSSSLSAMGRGSFGGSGSSGSKRSGRPDRKKGSGSPWERSKHAKRAGRTGARRKSGGGGGGGGGGNHGGPGAAEESKLHTLLQSLDLVEVDAPMAVGCSASPMVAVVGASASSSPAGGGGGGAGEEDAVAERPARRVRFAEE